MRQRNVTRMGELADKRNLTEGEKAEFDACEARVREIDATTRSYDNIGISGSRSHGDAPELRGEPNESIPAGRTMREWITAAAANGVTMTSDEGRQSKVEDRDADYLNAWWGQKLGFAQRESRALAEDGASSGQSIVPQVWQADFVDFLYANSVHGALGVTRFPMASE